MKLIEPSVEILEQSSGLNGIYEQIEIAGRTCYKSEPTYSYFYTGKNPHDGGDITVQVSKEFDGEKAIEYAELLLEHYSKSLVGKHPLNAIAKF